MLPVRARCLIHTILSAPQHPYFDSCLPRWVTHTHYWHECMCYRLFGPCACEHSTAAPACESMRTYYGCMHVHKRPCVQAYQCSLCVVLLCYYVLVFQWYYWWLVRQRIAPLRERRRELRQWSCATHDTMPRLDLAAPGAACTQSLGLSSSYCI